MRKVGEEKGEKRKNKNKNKIKYGRKMGVQLCVGKGRESV